MITIQKIVSIACVASSLMIQGSQKQPQSELSINGVSAATVSGKQLDGYKIYDNYANKPNNPQLAIAPSEQTFDVQNIIKQPAKVSRCQFWSKLCCKRCKTLFDKKNNADGQHFKTLAATPRSRSESVSGPSLPAGWQLFSHDDDDNDDNFSNGMRTPESLD